jgi:flagellar protein FliJ
MPKKFKFELQSVLDLKTFKEDLLRQDLAKLLRELNGQKEKIAALEIEYAASKGKLNEILLSSPDINKLSFYREYLNLIGKKIGDEKRILKVMQEVISEKRKELERALKEKKVMDKLKDRKLHEYTKEINSWEQKYIDEICSQRFISKRGAI